MNKHELAEIATSAYALYNQAIPEFDKKIILQAWWDLLQDLEYEPTKKALLNYAATYKTMPTPGEIRRRCVDEAVTVAETPTPLAAWGIVLRQISLANSGMATSTEDLHPCILRVMEVIGAGLYELQGKTDQFQFMRTYEQIVSEYQQQKYKIS